MALRGPVRAAARRWPDILFRAGAERRAVALTLDDGPDPSVTPAVLDLLAAAGCRATFFALGRAAERHPAIVARLVDEGHELGNHGWQDRPARALAAAEFEADLMSAHEVLAEHAPVSLMRPGSGLIRADQRRALRRRGYCCVLGSVYPLDAHLPQGPALGALVARWARPGDIVVLHEGPRSRVRVVAMLAAALEGLRERGLEATTVGGLLASREAVTSNASAE
jgi:peptidoglycan/xylan/chitin deacetylase (PgdA/CDA1 family)